MVNGFKIIGISVRTTNKNGMSHNDIPMLWQKFFAENVFDKIPNKISNDIIAIYTDYKSNFQDDYTTIIGCKVEDIENIPDGLIGREFPSDNFKKFVAIGKMPQAVFQKWCEIWNNDLQLERKYTYDFEVYGEKPHKGDASEVEIYLAVK